MRDDGGEAGEDREREGEGELDRQAGLCPSCGRASLLSDPVMESEYDAGAIINACIEWHQLQCSVGLLLSDE